MERRIDVLDDEGEIFQRNGPQICRAKYHLETWESTSDVGRERSGPGFTATRGRLDLPLATLGRMMRIGAGLQLLLADGRWLDFGFTSSDGTIQGLGAIRGSR